MTYVEFLKSKERSQAAQGVTPEVLSPLLKDFQRFSVSTSLKKARFALFEDCGLGKTFQALEWSRLVAAYTSKPVLNLAPFAVVDQTITEGEKFGIKVGAPGSNSAIQITNYEQLSKMDASVYGGVVIDESSILKNHEGAYRNLIMNAFKHTPFKLACTATPSPNDPMELGNHAEFLGIMNRSEMLATYFVHDGGDTSKWRIKGHAKDAFWRWVASWSLMFSKPSDIGFDAADYELPPLNFIERQIITPKRENGKLVNDVSVSATEFNRELRLTKISRLDEAAAIANASHENFIIWIKHNEEEQYLKRLIPDAVVVTGSEKAEVKKAKLLGFARGEFRVLITKTDIAAMGLNYQNCHNQIFASLDFSFEALYQAIRRSYRFGQLHAVTIYLITTDTMANVIKAIRQKEAQFSEMQTQMNKLTKELYGHEYRIAA